MTLPWRRIPGILFLCLLTGSFSLALQSRPQTVADGVYSQQQATRGRTTYGMRCASCHGAMLNGSGQTGPPLTGDDFNAKWSSQPLLDFANKIQRTMPRDDSERLTAQETSDLVAFILQSDKFPSGQSDLQMNEGTLKQITFPVIAPKPQAPPAMTTLLPPSGNLAQVMRGILFPSSNIIFTVQSVDPGIKKKPADNNVVGFDWLVWGGDVYKGWEVVDYASVAIAESAQLMLTPGRQCENGRPVPINDPDWIKYTNELAEAGKAAYKASQTRNQQLVSDSTNQLNDSCSHCHGVYRGRTHCVKR